MTERRPSLVRLAGLVLANELRGLLRDRRALLVGFVLPALLYPVLFLASDRLGRASRERIEQTSLQLLYDLDEAPAELRESILSALASRSGGETELREVDLEPDISATELREQFKNDTDALVRAVVPAGEPLQLELHGDFASEGGSTARSHVHDALGTLREAYALELLIRAVGDDPGAALEPHPVDVSSAEDRAGLGLGRLLPLIAILVLVSGGSFAALGAFAGERESGTLETLLVQPVPAAAIAWGKYAAVLLSCVVALVGNVASFIACVALELGTLPGSDAAGVDALPGAGRLLYGSLLLLPVAALVAAALSYVCARARSYREGQHYVTPLTLVALVPGALAASPEVQLDALTAVVPVAGPAIALREALRGGLGFGAFLGVAGAAFLWVAIALRGLAGTLDAERLLGTPDAEGESAQRRVQSKTALRYGLAAVFLVYVIGGELQAKNPLVGLMATLWLLVPALALASARGTARRSGRPLAETLGIVRASPWHLLGALWLAPGLAWCARAFLEWQSSVLPLPKTAAGLSDPAELLGTDHPAILFFVLALSPALMEELLFRGALLSGLRADLSARRCILWQALLFALVHLSVHRFLATAVMGACLAALALRARSLWPTVVLHGAYNGILVATALESSGAERLLDGPWPLVSLAGLGMLALPAARRSARS